MKDKIARSLADEVYGEHLKLRDRVNINTNSIAEFKSKYVECENCGCLVRKEKAIKVQEMVDKNERHASLMEKITEFGLGYPSGSINITSTAEPDMEIKTTYYCLHCNPNKNEKITKTKTKRKMRKKGNRK